MYIIISIRKTFFFIYFDRLLLLHVSLTLYTIYTNWYQEKIHPEKSPREESGVGVGLGQGQGQVQGLGFFFPGGIYAIPNFSWRYSIPQSYIAGNVCCTVFTLLSTTSISLIISHECKCHCQYFQLSLQLKIQNQPPEVFYIKRCSQIVRLFHSLFFKKLADLTPAALLRKRH